jgi:hypothetical protein
MNKKKWFWIAVGAIAGIVAIIFIVGSLGAC